MEEYFTTKKYSHHDPLCSRATAFSEFLVSNRKEITRQRILRNFFKALNRVLVLSRFFRSSCSHQFVPGCTAPPEPGYDPERTICSMFLEHGELWDEHLVDDVDDASVRDHVRLKDMSTIDLDAFSHSGGHCVGTDIVQRGSGSDFFL